MIRTVMAEGEDHYRTFLAIQEWLSPHPEDQYLRAVNLPRPPANNQEHVALQAQYAALLNLLYNGYSVGMPQGASDLNMARNAMIGKNGIAVAAEAVAQKGFLVIFVTPADPHFNPVAPPP